MAVAAEFQGSQSAGPARVLRRAPAPTENWHATGHLRALGRNPLVGCVVLRDDLGGNPATLTDLVATLFRPRTDFRAALPAGAGPGAAATARRRGPTRLARID